MCAGFAPVGNVFVAARASSASSSEPRTTHNSDDALTFAVGNSRAVAPVKNQDQRAKHLASRAKIQRIAHVGSAEAGGGSAVQKPFLLSIASLTGTLPVAAMGRC